jgi:hypothetical protein
VSTFQLAKWARFNTMLFQSFAKNGNKSIFHKVMDFPKKKKFIFENFKSSQLFFIFFWILKGSNFWGLKKKKKRGLKIHKVIYVF